MSNLQRVLLTGDFSQDTVRSLLLNPTLVKVELDPNADSIITNDLLDAMLTTYRFPVLTDLTFHGSSEVNFDTCLTLMSKCPCLQRLGNLHELGVDYKRQLQDQVRALNLNIDIT